VTPMSDLQAADAPDPEDAKLIILARGARERVSADTGAAVRDDTGRTYAAADAPMPSFPISAVQLAVGQAWASGARGLEAAVIVAQDPDAPMDVSVVVDLGGVNVPVFICAADGTVLRVVQSGVPDTADGI
jgi:hypothetical protein